jgi:hypothetical protein
MTSETCQGITKKGIRCSYKPKINSEYCSIHRQTIVNPKRSVQEDVTMKDVDMGDLTFHFPNDIIREILKYLDFIDLTLFTSVSKSCGNFVSYFKLMNEDDKLQYLHFKNDFQMNVSLINCDFAEQNAIPVPVGQHLVLYPTKFIPMTKIEFLIQKGVVVSFTNKTKEGSTSWYHNVRDKFFENNFVKVNKSMKHLIESKSIVWNFRNMFCHIVKISKTLHKYQIEHPERKRM